MSKNSKIEVIESSVHNLKNISVSIPKNKFTVITGPSGSGKSSLAFDTIYAEGQKRYLEALSLSSANFVSSMQSPNVKLIRGLLPTIAIDQKTMQNSSRSTVGTITEIFDFLRILYANIGTLYCPVSNQPITKYSLQEICNEIINLPLKSRISIATQIDTKREKINFFIKSGYINSILNDQPMLLDELPKKFKKDDTLYLVIDRIILKENSKKRILDAVNKALYEGRGSCTVFLNNTKYKFYSTKLISPVTLKEYPPLEPRYFSFNSPLGQCPNCKGLGIINKFNIGLMLEDSNNLTTKNIIPLQHDETLAKLVDKITSNTQLDNCTLEKIFYGKNLPKKIEIQMHNSKITISNFQGIIKWLEDRYTQSESEKERSQLERFMTQEICPTCAGTRLNAQSKLVKINNITINEIITTPLHESYTILKNIKLSKKEKEIGGKTLNTILERIKYLIDSGLNYLTLNRGGNTLSGGELQRIRLATQISNSLSGILYILDEPSIGLHPHDNKKMLQSLKDLIKQNNTLIVVEHDEEIIKNADHIIDLGPKAGVHGGEVIATGSVEEIIANKKSPTGKFLKNKVSLTEHSRMPINDWITINQINQFNLKNLDVKFPLNGLTCITGVSGSGKSTLIHKVLVPAVKYALRPHLTQYNLNNFSTIQGIDNLASIIEITQKPIGKSAKSNPATFTGIFDEIRKIFAKLPEAQLKGFRPGHFSFNTKQGRCPECEGHGLQKIDMRFLPSIFFTCAKCKGKQYNDDILKIKFKGMSIADILSLTVNQAQKTFKLYKKINRILLSLQSVGLGYITLGQSALTLSGGEAQRLKLAKELAKTTKGKCLYILDEPTTGLHFQDIEVLMYTIKQLTQKGHPVIIIEHNRDVLKYADYIIDLGPLGGDKGGKIIAYGTPEEIIKNKHSLTGKYLN